MSVPVTGQLPLDKYTPDNYPPDNYPWTSTPRIIPTPDSSHPGQFPPRKTPPWTIPNPDDSPPDNYPPDNWPTDNCQSGAPNWDDFITLVTNTNCACVLYYFIISITNRPNSPEKKVIAKLKIRTTSIFVRDSRALVIYLFISVFCVSGLAIVRVGIV